MMGEIQRYEQMRRNIVEEHMLVSDCEKLRGKTIQHVNSGFDGLGYPVIEVVLECGTILRFVADGYNVDDIIVQIEEG
jgi:hypothetical protein